MTWPPAPWLIVAAWVVLAFCLLGLWVLACVWAERRGGRRRPDRPAPAAGAAEWLADALQDWPGPELDDEILARQIQVARALREGRLAP